MRKPILMIVDDDEAFSVSLGRALKGEYEIRSATSAFDAKSLLSPPPDVILLDLRLNESDSANREGINLLQVLHEQLPQTPILMITAYGDIEIAVESIRLGAVDFLQKPRADIREIKARIERALDHSRLSQRVTQLEQELKLIEPRQIVGNSAKIQETKRMIEAVARAGSATVLIRGETGTGKELIARAIHANSPRQSGPFVPVMLNALPHSIVEAELFGYEAGAFTDARKGHMGYLEKAHGGTLFLDEVGEVDAAVQIKLLRFLEEREFQRLGSTASTRVDVQIIAATNAELKDRIREGRFREDLYFRLNIHEIHLPPLRERAEDIQILVEHFLGMFRQQGKKVRGIAPEVVQVLRSLSWPGNIRQLRNATESAIFRAEVRGHSVIELKDLPNDLLEDDFKPSYTKAKEVNEIGFSIHEALDRTELSYIEQALSATHGKKAEVWRLLGYNDRFALYRRVRRILKQHPHLKEEFPLLKANFGTRNL